MIFVKLFTDMIAVIDLLDIAAKKGKILLKEGIYDNRMEAYLNGVRSYLFTH